MGERVLQRNGNVEGSTASRRRVEAGEVSSATDAQTAARFYAAFRKGLSFSAKGGGGAGREELDSVVTSAMIA